MAKDKGPAEVVIDLTMESDEEPPAPERQPPAPAGLADPSSSRAASLAPRYAHRKPEGQPHCTVDQLLLR